MSARSWVEAGLEEDNPAALFADRFNDALVGYTAYQPGPRQQVAIYDIERVLDVLVGEDGMDRDEAQEYLDFNVLGAWMGENTPLFLVPYSATEDLARPDMIHS